MSKKDIMDNEPIECLEKMIGGLVGNYHFRIHTMYHLKVPPQWAIQQRRNDDHHLVYVKSGRGWYEIEGERVSLIPGRIIFVSNGCLHSSGTHYTDTPHILPIRFGLYDNQTMEHKKVFEKPFYITTIDYNYIEFLHIFEQLYRYYKNNEMIGYKEVCSSLLVELMVLLLHHHRKQDLKKDAKIETIKEFIDNHHNHRISIEDLAKKFGLSTKHLSRLFKNNYGITPKQYQIRSIIDNANFYIDNTTLSIGEIAIKLGYPDLYTFSKQYKKITGYSPNKKRHS